MFWPTILPPSGDTAKLKNAKLKQENFPFTVLFRHELTIFTSRNIKTLKCCSVLMGRNFNNFTASNLHK
jgi:hypothetical protein